MVALGNLYSEGADITRDQAEAFKWYKMAAEKGVPIVEIKLGTLYY
jgi:TPR repeat protein